MAPLPDACYACYGWLGSCSRLAHLAPRPSPAAASSRPGSTATTCECRGHAPHPRSLLGWPAGAPALQLHAALCTTRPLGSPIFQTHTHTRSPVPPAPSHGLFTPRVFAVKWAGSAAALGASLCLGLEAPMVHLGAAVASLVSNADQRACWCVYTLLGCW